MKLALKIIGALLAMALIFAILAPSFISRDFIKNKLVEQVELATGRKLTVGGNFRVSFFPSVAITMENASLSGLDNKPLVSLKSLDVGLELFPLLRKEIIVKKLDLDEPVIYLQRKASGESNWVFTPVEKPTAKKKSGKDSYSGGGFKVSNVKITNGNISYSDESTGKSWQLDDTNLIVKGSPNKPFSVKGSGSWQKKLIKITADIDTLESFIDNKKTQISLNAQSDLFDINFEGFSEKREYSGKAEISSGSIKELQQWLDPSSKPLLDAPLELNVSSDLVCTAVHCDFKKTAIVIDKIKANGNISFEIGSRKPSLNVDLNAEDLDLNPFLPVTSRKQSSLFIGEAFAAAEKGWSREPINLSGLNAIDATINIKAKSLLVHKIKIGKTILRAKILNGRLSADILDADLYNGKGNITLAIDSASAVIEKHASFRDIDAASFLADAMDENRISGKANMEINMITRGVSEYDMVSNLQGKGQFRFQDGAIRGINVADMIRNVQSAFKDVNTGSQATDFAEMGGTFTIENGIVKNSDLAMKAPLMRLSGAGQVNLPARTISYRLKPEIVETAQGQGGKDKHGLGVPIIIEGTIDNPVYRPDLQGVVHDVINDPQKIKDTVKDIQGQFKGENKKDTIKNLKGFLKGI